MNSQNCTRAREAEAACCAEFMFTKSLERIEIPQYIYESCDGLGLLSKDPIGFALGDTNLYCMTGNHPNMATDPSGLFEDGAQSSADVHSEMIQWIEFGRGEVSDAERRRVAAKLKQLQRIKSKLEEQERIAMRIVGKAVFDQSTGLGKWRDIDKKTGYLPFVHEGVDYMDGTAQNAVYIVSGGASNDFGFTDTTEHIG